jgi:hypothetical protein
MPGPVQVRWSASGGGYELPEAVLHRVRFDDAAAPEWVSDHRMAGVQDSRAGALRRLTKGCDLR